MAKAPPMPASAAKPKSAKALGKQPSFMAGKSKPFGAPPTKGAAKPSFEKSAADKDRGMKEGSAKDMAADTRQKRKARLMGKKL